MKKGFKKKNLIIFLSLILFIFSISFAQRAFTKKRLKVVGTSQYLKYLNAGLDISEGGRPIEGLKVYLNEILLSNRGSGFYSAGTPYPYKMALGKTIVISYLPEEPIRRTHEKPRPIILGTYKINNYIEWVFPLPNATISLGRSAFSYIIFRWNYVGRILKTKVTLENFTKHSTVFSTIVTDEKVSIPKNILKSGNTYRFDLEVVGAMGQFRLTEATAKGSKIDFYYWDHIYFRVR